MQLALTNRLLHNADYCVLYIRLALPRKHTEYNSVL